MNKKLIIAVIGIFKRFAAMVLMCASLLFCGCFDVIMSPTLTSGKVPISDASDSIEWGLCYSRFSIDFYWTVPKGKDACIQDSLPYLRKGNFVVYKDSMYACVADSLGNLHDVILPGERGMTTACKNSMRYCWRFLLKGDVRNVKVICPQKFLKLDGKNFLMDSIPVKWGVIPIRTSILPGKWGWGHSQALILDK